MKLYTHIRRRRVQYCIYFVEAEILVEGVARYQYFWPRRNKYNIGQGGVQLNVLLYPNNVHPTLLDRTFIKRSVLFLKITSQTREPKCIVGKCVLNNVYFCDSIAVNSSISICYADVWLFFKYKEVRNLRNKVIITASWNI